MSEKATGACQCAVGYIHGIEVAHRNIKLDSISISAGGRTKLCDFGLYRESCNDDPMVTTCGALVHTAPETIQEMPCDGTKADIWGAGIVLCAMVSNHFPWETDEELSAESVMRETARRITDGDIEIPEELSEDLQDLIGRTLNLDPEARPTAREILKHRWLEGVSGGVVVVTPDDALITKVEGPMRSLEAEWPAP